MCIHSHTHSHTGAMTLCARAHRTVVLQMCSGIEAYRKCLEDASCFKADFKADFKAIRQQYKDKYNEAPKNCGTSSIQSKNIVPLVFGDGRGSGGGDEEEVHVMKNSRESHYVYYLLPND